MGANADWNPDHIVHHLLALWALGASPEEIQDMWDFNISYQAPLKRNAAAAPDNLDLSDPVLFNQCLGKDECYYDFLVYFENEVTEKGVPDVVHEYVFKGDERANDIFCRMFTDLVHPMIHLGCALEFKQPSLVAEALAAACVHGDWPKQVLMPTEEYLRSNTTVPSSSLLQILDSLRQDADITSGVKHTDPYNKIPDGLLRRVKGKQFAPYLGQFQVSPTPESLQRKMAEMMHTCAYMAGAAQHPGKREAIDFVLLHTVTLLVFYPAILALDWLSNHDKARLLEATARLDAVMYAGCGCPPLYPQRIVDYVPQHPGHGWPELFHRSVVYRDEGHVAKMIRALFSLEQLGLPAGDFPIAKKDFVKIAHMAVDSVEKALEPDGNKMPEAVAQAMTKRVGQGGEMVMMNQIRWVFYGGLDKAWDYVPDLS